MKAGLPYQVSVNKYSEINSNSTNAEYLTTKLNRYLLLWLGWCLCFSDITYMIYAQNCMLIRLFNLEDWAKA